MVQIWKRKTSVESTSSRTLSHTTGLHSVSLTRFSEERKKKHDI